MAEPLREPLLNHLTGLEGLPQRARIVVGVSGGADSVALLHLLRTLQSSRHLTLHVAHLDHGLRPASRDDARFVQQLAAQWHLPVTVERRDVAAACDRHGWSLEDGARRIRYEFLAAVAGRQSASHLALAHTADDQAETVLMRLLRGSGLMGLAAIPVTRQLNELRIVRPLLQVWRRDLLDYLTRAGVAYREDETNSDPRFLRNRIRHRLLPLLEQEYNPQIKHALTQLADQSRCDYAYLEAASGRQWKRTAKQRSASQVALSVAAFLRQPKALQRQLLRRAVSDVSGQPLPIEFRHWLEAERLFAQRPVGTLVDLPGGVQLRRDREHVVVSDTLRLRLAERSRYTMRTP